jgi:hypothetical protein
MLVLGTSDGETSSNKRKGRIMTTTYTPITGIDNSGNRVWYTGRSGQGFVSHDHEDAFLGYTLNGARDKAAKLNKMTSLHGIYFVAVTGELLNQFGDNLKITSNSGFAI